MVDARIRMRSGLISAVNLSEVYCKAISVGKRPIIDAIVQTAELRVVSFDRNLASLTASLEASTRGKGISFADRVCLALGLNERLPILTGDHTWAKLDLNVELDFFRSKSNFEA